MNRTYDGRRVEVSMLREEMSGEKRGRGKEGLK